jgi:hypothetical protein
VGSAYIIDFLPTNRILILLLVVFRPAVITRLSNNQTLFTETLLIALPTPDFSMPYNVITMTCTILALFFGSAFNSMMRDFKVVQQTPGSGDEKWWVRLVKKLKSRLGK